MWRLTTCSLAVVRELYNTTALFNKIHSVCYRLVFSLLDSVFSFWRVQVWHSSSNQMTKQYFTNHFIIFTSSLLLLFGQFMSTWCLPHAEAFATKAKCIYNNMNKLWNLHKAMHTLWQAPGSIISRCSENELLLHPLNSSRYGNWTWESGEDQARQELLSHHITEVITEMTVHSN